MITNEQLRDDLRHEVRIIQHLATKVPEGQLDWRPTPAQRSTRELLQYLTYCAIGPAESAVNGHWETMQGHTQAAESATPENFAERMDAQMAGLDALIAPLGAEDFSRPATLPWGASTQLGIALVDMVLKTLVAYRMQLFLYAKQSGNSTLGPANCWVGVDMQQPNDPQPKEQQSNEG